MAERVENNCIGYVYFQQGISDREIPVPTPLYRDLLKHFVRVPEVVFADVVAVVYSSRLGPAVGHLALVDDGKQTITHRRGINKPATTGPIEGELESYTRYDEVEIIFLRRK